MPPSFALCGEGRHLSDDSLNVLVLIVGRFFGERGAHFLDVALLSGGDVCRIEAPCVCYLDERLQFHPHLVCLWLPVPMLEIARV
jgi:hypothetical protein